MRGTPSCSTTSACLPIARRTWQHASADPTASPSGRACEVSTKRSCCPICRSTSSILLCLFSTGSLAGLAAFLGPRQQFFDSRFLLLRTIQAKIQFRGTPQMQALYQFMTNIFAGSLQALEALIRISVVAFDIDPNLRRAAIIGDVDRGHADQANAGIGQFAFDEGFDLLAERFANPPAMV